MSSSDPRKNNPITPPYKGYTITSKVKDTPPFYVWRPGGGQLVNDADPDADPYADIGGFSSIENAQARINESAAI
ncbi:hypothetical protein [Pseudomonas gingeri]|uniref:hypothetical protein n=1 Tax=Pseudomonas gingeri TaxID=117681 RepID=UPI0015A05472|nr:hypothetical protein [Pseudomonas gingeri]NWA02393.1 hypothetical protein [Pseudomonas gingeri]NWA12434.1 hypothetical protein [Pseudomonas gingeri]NWA57160.1 hypothetical protein [Pseudomonas gingeri]NWA93503.1 hypothetical protein [Pseudomonas gingeri]NWB02975.1 hypothetical protein [Pseudomonas gingeri]